MDTRLVEEAIRKAINGGAAQARPKPLLSPGDEMELERAQTDVEIGSQVFEDYIADLKRDPQMARFDSAFVTVPTGHGASSSLESVARLLLARAIASGDVSGTVETFRFYVEKNSAPMIAVMAVRGAKTTGEVRLGPHIRLLPLTSVPPSWLRQQALGHTHALPNFPALSSSPASSALVTDLDFGPIFYWPSEGGVPSAAAHQRVTSALHHLDEARMLLSLLEISTSFRLFWVHPKDPLMRAGASAGWLSGRERFDGKDVEVDVEDAEALAALYFGIDDARPRETLHIPLDRLDRAVRGDDLADRSIDLGIALEALLLHEPGKQYQGELKFRLALHGAWLGGDDPQDRAEIQKTLKDVYDLRSRAVHTGRVEPNQKNYEMIERGTLLCKRLILKMIQADGRVEWSTLLLGGPTGEA
jgi:Apea-like HEPN